MQNYKLEVLGQDISFKANADQERLEQARQMLDNRYSILKQHGRHLSKEKLLTFLALALADDLLALQADYNNAKEKARKIMTKLERGAGV